MSHFRKEEDWKPVDDRMFEIGYTLECNGDYRVYKNVVDGMRSTITQDADQLTACTELTSDLGDDLQFRSEYENTISNLDDIRETLLERPLFETTRIIDWIATNNFPITLPDDLLPVCILGYSARRIYPSTFVNGLRIDIDAAGVRNRSNEPGTVSFEYVPLGSKARGHSFTFRKSMPEKDIKKDTIMSMYASIVSWASSPGNLYRVVQQELTKRSISHDESGKTSE